MTDKKIAVIGSGPAGMHSALLLARKGCNVEIFEKEALPGGMLQYYLPKFRFSRDGIAPKIEVLKQIGVEIKLGTEIGKEHPLQEIVEGFDAVVFTPGEWNARKLGIDGVELSNVQYWLEFLRKYNEDKIESLEGKEVVVIGAGDTAMDCARAAVKLGAKTKIAYRRGKKEMPAMEQEVKGAEEDGVEFSMHLSPQKFVGSEKLETIVFDKTVLKDGKVEKTGETVDVKTDLVIIAIGQQPNLEILEGSPYKSFEELPGNVVLAGDLVNEKKLIATAIQSAAAAVEKIEKILEAGKSLN
ncbi:MAG: FAD-dependent oxidoreductase [archaeon]|jgi:NADPH-dependent glutamate synthase beta subunit-like oxidoreductase|nr:FAD-dependent oxidoreductase [archaeon]